MRFVIRSEGTDPIVLRSDAEPVKIGWYIAENGIHGWFGTPEPREDPVSRFNSDGDAWPPLLSSYGMTTQGARVFSFDVIAKFDSTIECARGRDRINALAGEFVTVTGFEALGPRSVECYLSDDPDPELTVDEQNMMFTLTFTAPYPHKTGEERQYPANGSTVQVVNHGNCMAYPRLIINGCSAASISYAGQTVSWSGRSSWLSLDLSQDLSWVEGLTNDDAFAVGPGRHTLNVSHTGGDLIVELADTWM